MTSQNDFAITSENSPDIVLPPRPVTPESVDTSNAALNLLSPSRPERLDVFSQELVTALASFDTVVKTHLSEAGVQNLKKRDFSAVRETMFQTLFLQPNVNITRELVMVVPFLNNSLVPTTAIYMDRYRPLLDQCKIPFGLISTRISNFIIDKKIPEILTKPPFISQSPTPLTLAFLSLPMFGLRKYDEITLPDEEEELVNWVMNLIICSSISKFITYRTLYHDVEGTPRVDPFFLWVISHFRPTLAKPCTLPKLTPANRALKLSLQAELAVSVRAYIELVKRVSYSLSGKDPLKLEETVKDLSKNLHSGVFVAPNQGYGDFIPGFKLYNNLSSIAAKTDSIDVEFLESRIAGKLSKKTEELAFKMKDEIISDLRIKDMFDEIRQAAEKANKVGDSFANVIDSLRTSIPIFGLFFCLVVYFSFKTATGTNKEVLRKILISSALAVGISYVTVPQIWNVFMKMTEGLDITEPVNLESKIEIVPNQGFELSEDGVSTLITLISLVGFIPPEKRSLTTILAPLASMTRGIRDILRVSYELFVMMATNVQEYFGWDTKIWGIFCPRYREWTAIAEKIGSEATTGTLEISAAKEVEIQGLIEVGEALLIELDKTVHKPLLPLIKTTIVDLRQLKANITNRIANYKPYKSAAPCVFLHGESKQGKTEMTKFLVEGILKLLLTPEDYQKYLLYPSNYVAAAPQDKFWDNVSAGIRILKIPEFNQFPSTKGNSEEADSRNIYRFCDPEPAIVRMADVKMKGAVLIQPDIVIATSNQSTISFEEGTDINSLMRRLNIPIKVSLKPGANPDVIDPDNWVLMLGVPSRDSSGTFTDVRTLTLQELVVYCVSTIRKAEEKNVDTSRIIQKFADQVASLKPGEVMDFDAIDAAVRAKYNTLRAVVNQSGSGPSPSFVPRRARNHSGYAQKFVAETDDEDSEMESDSDEPLIRVGRHHFVDALEPGVTYTPMYAEVSEMPDGTTAAFAQVLETAPGRAIITGSRISKITIEPRDGKKIIQLAKDGKTYVPRSKMSVDHLMKMKFGYDSVQIPDHVPFLHGLRLRYPRFQFLSAAYYPDELGGESAFFDLDTDDIFSSFGQIVTGLNLRAEEVRNLLVAKFGDISDWTLDRLLAMAEFASQYGPSSIGFSFVVPAGIAIGIKNGLSIMANQLLTLATKFKNFIFDGVKTLYKWVREHESLVSVVLLTLGGILAYRFFTREDGGEIIFDQSGNGNMNLGREAKTTASIAGKDRLKGLARNYKAGNQSGITNAKSRADVCEGNMVHLKGLKNGVEVNLGYATFIMNRDFVMPMHFYEETIAVQTGDGICLEEIAIIFEFKEGNKKVLLSQVELLSDEVFGEPDHNGNRPEKDLVLCRILNKSVCGNFRSILKHLADQRSIDAWKTGRDFNESAIICPSRRIEDKVIGRSNILAVSKILDRQTMRTMVARYKGSFQNGDCGMLIMSAQGEIIGFHTNGTTGYGYGAVFSREEIAKMLNLCSDEERTKDILEEINICLTAPPAITNQGYDLACHSGEIITMNSPFKSGTYVQNKYIPFVGEGEVYFERKTGVTRTHIMNYAQARAKYVDTPISASDKHVEACIQQVCSEMFDIDRNAPKGTFSFAQALFGIPNSKFKKLPVQTSAGHPLSTTNLKKSDFYSFDTAGNPRFGPRIGELRESIQAYFDTAQTGSTPITYFMDTLKNERRPMEKLDKPRLVSVAPLELTVVCRMVYGPLMEYAIKHAKEIGFAFTVNPYSEEWNDIAISLRSMGGDNRFGAGDYSGFDAHHPSRYMHMVFGCLRKWFGDDGLDLVRKAVEDNICNSTHVFGTVCEIWNVGMPSGNPMTTILNCILNQAYFRYWWLKIHAFDLSCLPHFREHVQLFVNGDDNLYAVSDDYSDLATELIIGECMADLGQVYTDDKKLSTSSTLRTFDDVTLSKRSFRYDHEREIWVAPLDLNVVLEIPLWTRKSDYMNIARDNTKVALRELSLHGEDVYNKWAPQIISYFGPDLHPDTDVWSIQYAITLATEAQM